MLLLSFIFTKKFSFLLYFIISSFTCQDLLVEMKLWIQPSKSVRTRVSVSVAGKPCGEILVCGTGAVFSLFCGSSLWLRMAISTLANLYDAQLLNIKVARPRSGT